MHYDSKTNVIDRYSPQQPFILIIPHVRYTSECCQKLNLIMENAHE